MSDEIKPTQSVEIVKTPVTQEDLNNAIKRFSQEVAAGNIPVPLEAKLSSTPPDYDDVALFGLSLRGYITFMLIGTVCVLSALNREIGEVIKDMALIALGFYFSKK